MIQVWASDERVSVGVECFSFGVMYESRGFGSCAQLGQSLSRGFVCGGLGSAIGTVGCSAQEATCFDAASIQQKSGRA